MLSDWKFQWPNLGPSVSLSLKSNKINIDDLGGSHNLDFDGNFEGVMMFDSQNNHNEFSNQLQQSIHHDFENMK